MLLACLCFLLVNASILLWLLLLPLPLHPTLISEPSVFSLPLWMEVQCPSRDPPGPQLQVRQAASPWSECLLPSQLLQNVGSHDWTAQPVT